MRHATRLYRTCGARGIDVGPTLECELALLEDLTLTFAIVDKKTKSPIEMVLKDED